MELLCIPSTIAFSILHDDIMCIPYLNIRYIYFTLLYQIALGSTERQKDHDSKKKFIFLSLKANERDKFKRLTRFPFNDI